MTTMTHTMAEGSQLPYLIEGSGPDGLAGLPPDRLHALLAEHGAVLLRGLGLGGVTGFDRFVRSASGAPIAYTERSSPRHVIQGEIYTSTDYPPEEEIFLHNENSYQLSWPRYVYFYCASPPTTLGATPLADIRRVYASIDPQVAREFADRGWMVVRNFHDGFGVPWSYVFGTQDRSEVERYCRANGIEVEWRGQGSLQTRAVRQAVHLHPGTGQDVWFNHIAFFHFTTAPAEVGEGLLALFGEEDLPTNTCYGDGGRIPPEVVAHLRDCYRAASVRFDWQEDDVLMVDNMLAAHGREPFTGPRSIAVAMTDPYWPGVSAS
ncbi:MAG TPA: TauD/TfdA family dioxygenase [Streptosporangiaceae bacterium]|jgi:alpha-ketoglutarate-dependent taurine dioxygenase|nr:TauD/TfdA family dioxygenase [Streptosporangiaceae bacterium]